MRIAVASGKGGTGKTTLAVNMVAALSSRAPCYVDCDVEEPNGHLYLSPRVGEEEVITVPVPRALAGRCSGCGRCQEVCQFRAILALRASVMVFDSLCHGCGTCLLACPEKALTEEERPIGVARRGTVSLGEGGEVGFLDGRLNVGEVRSTPLIAAVRKREPGDGLVIADAPPGATCPTMEAIRESDLVLLVAEPTPFGLHDLAIVLELAGTLGLPAAVVINRADLGDGRVSRFCEEKGVPVLDEIPYDPQLAAAGAEARVAAAGPGPARERFRRIAEAAVELARSGGRRAPARAVGVSAAGGKKDHPTGSPRPLLQVSAQGPTPPAAVRQWVVASGKGGTGKTSLIASFARLAGRVVLADADVDAANLALGLSTRREANRDFYSGSCAEIAPDLCTRCGACLEVCRFEAIEEGDPYEINELACEGCNACAVICPQDAVRLAPNRAGELMESSTPYGPLVHAELGIAQENSGKLVAEVVETAKKRAAEESIALLLIDGPPGIGCPVHAALSGAERLLAVTEPTVSGLHDLDRLLQLAEHFRIPAAVCVNRWDVAPKEAERVEAHCRERSVPVVGMIPFDRGLPAGLCQGVHPLDAAAPQTGAAIEATWEAWAALETESCKTER